MPSIVAKSREDLAATAPTKVCNGCFRELPITDFRFRRRAIGERHSLCRKCAADYERERRHAEREGQIRGFTASAIEQRNPAALAALAARMIRRYGGLGKFAEGWMAAIDRASAHGRHCSVLRSFRAIAQMVAAAESLAPDPAEMSDDKLREAELEAAAELIRREPRIALAAAQSLGWQVTPPPSYEGS